MPLNRAVESEQALHHAIEINDLQFRYPDAPEKTVLDIAEWKVKPAESVFLYGPSGSGKSTLLNLIGGILRPSSGKIVVSGSHLDTMSQSARDQFRANRIGYVFQQFNLIPYLSAIDNVRLATRFSKRAKHFDFDDEFERLLMRLYLMPSDVCKPAHRLSVGQQQRVAIARALINKPEILIVDEPTSSLDESNRDNFISILMTLVREHGITLLFVSHDMMLAHYFQRIDALEDINAGEVSC